MMGIIDEKRSRIVKNGESNSKTTKEEGEEVYINKITTIIYLYLIKYIYHDIIMN